MLSADLAVSSNMSIRVSLLSDALRKSCWLVCMLGICFSPLNALAQSGVAASKPPRPVNAPSPQQQIVPYWTAEPGWHTESSAPQQSDIGLANGNTFIAAHGWRRSRAPRCKHCIWNCGIHQS
jgi:hypothetical protein